MGKSHNPNTYSDVAAVMDAVLANGGEGIYRCSHPAEATRWRARFYQLRLLLRNLAAEVTPPGIAPVTKYDHIFVQYAPDNRCHLRISLRKPAGELVDFSGKPISVVLGKDVQRDPLQDEADALLDMMRDA